MVVLPRGSLTWRVNTPPDDVAGGGLNWVMKTCDPNGRRIRLSRIIIGKWNANNLEVGKKKRTCFACLIAVAIVESGCYAPPPPVAVQAGPPLAVAPAPPPPVNVVYAPDYYVWDGYEYVGVSGGQYVYWTGGTWIVCDPVILGRFYGWERYHPEWRRSAVRYHRERGAFR